MSPGTKFAGDFCGGIGPLQLGVVLVFYITRFEKKSESHTYLHIILSSSKIFSS